MMMIYLMFYTNVRMMLKDLCLFWQGRKDVVSIFNNLLRRQIGTRTPTVEYIVTKQEILFDLMKG